MNVGTFDEQQLYNSKTLKNITLVCNTVRCASCRFEFVILLYRNAMHNSYSLFCKSFRILGTLFYKISWYSSTTCIRIVRNDYINASNGIGIYFLDNQQSRIFLQIVPFKYFVAFYVSAKHDRFHKFHSSFEVIE